MAGHRGLMDSTLGSGDRVCGFKSRSWRSVFSGLFSSSFFFFPHHVTSLSPNACWPVNSGLRLCTGEAKRELTWKILAAPSVEAKLRSECDVWERGYKKTFKAINRRTGALHKLFRMNVYPANVRRIHEQVCQHR